MAGKRAPLNLDAVKASKPDIVMANKQNVSTATKQDAAAAKRQTSVEATSQNRASEARKAISLRLNPAAWRQLKILAVDEEKPAHDLLIEALNLLFEQRGKPPVA